MTGYLETSSRQENKVLLNNFDYANKGHFRPNQRPKKSIKKPLLEPYIDISRLKFSKRDIKKAKKK